MYFIFSVLLTSCQPTLCKQIVIIFVEAPRKSGRCESVLHHVDNHLGNWRVEGMGEHASACALCSGLIPCHGAAKAVPKPREARKMEASAAVICPDFQGGEV